MIRHVPDLKWAFPIDPAYGWFQAFEDNFASPDISFLVDIEDDRPRAYALSSIHLSDLDDEEGIRSRAAGLKSILDGAFQLVHGLHFRPFDLEGLYEIDGERAYGYAKKYPDITASPFSSSWALWIGSWRCSRNSNLSFEAAMLWLARMDDISRGMLQFLGINGCTWVSMYALVDFMKGAGLSNEDIAAAAGSTLSEVKRFTQTANNFAAIGPFCRHGEQGWAPPKIPMKHEEAAALVLSAAKQFLLNKARSLGVPEAFEKSKR